jgi:hypothetical protein
MAPPQPRKGPTRVPQNPLMGGVPSPVGGPLGQMFPPRVGSFSQYQSPPAGSPLTGSAANFYQQPQLSRSPLNMASRVQALAGMNQQNAGMESLIGQIQGLTQRSQAQNPMLPNSPLYGQQSRVETPQLQAQRDFIQRQEAARQQNTRYGDFSPPAGQAYSNGLDISPEAMAARQAQRLGAMQPGGAQMQQRFGPASPLGQQASQYASDQARKDAGQGVFIQEGGYGQPQEFLPFNNTRLGAEANARAMAERRRTDPTAPGYRSEQKRTDQLKEGIKRREAALASGLPKQRAQEKMQRLQDRTLKRAVARGLNPLSPQAQAMYPEAAGRLLGARAGGGPAPANPLNPSNPFITGAGGKVTAQDQQNAETGGVALVHGAPGPPDKDGNPTQGPQGNPFLQHVGAAPDKVLDSDMGTVHAGMSANLTAANPVAPTPEDLRAVHAYAQAVRSKYGIEGMKTSPGFTATPARRAAEHGVWKSLAELPANASDKELADWYGTFKDIAGAQYAVPDYSPPRMPGNPGYATGLPSRN